MISKFSSAKQLALALFSLALCLLSSSQAYANTSITIEDAESGNTSDWVIYDNTPAGATIANEFDSTLNSNVIAITGNGTANSFRIGGTSADSGFDIQDKHLASWRVNTDQPFVFYIATTTSNGFRYLVYRSIDNSRGLVADRYVFTGLGDSTLDGQWHTISQDLQADLSAAEPGNQILSIHGFQARGVMRLDDIAFHGEDTQTQVSAVVVEDAQSGNTNGWVVSDKTPPGASINNEFDSTLDSRVIALTGDGVNNSFRLGSTSSASGFNIEDRDLASWRVKTDEPFVFYIATTTSNGFRFLVYRSIDNSRGLVANRYVFTGLGDDTLDGQWHTITRNLQADLSTAEPGNQIVAIHGFQARGVMHLDDITFHGDEDPDSTAPPTPELISPLANAALETNATVSFSWASSSNSSLYQFRIVDTANASLDAPTAFVPASNCLENSCQISIVLDLPAANTYQWQVRATNDVGSSSWALSTFEVTPQIVEPPAAPVLISPLAGTSVTAGQTVDFQWQQDQQALSYELLLTDADNGDLPVVGNLQPAAICDASVCTYSRVVDFSASESHRWQVRAHYQATESEWAQSLFTVVPDTDAVQPVADFTILGFDGNATGQAPLTLSFDPSASYDNAGIVSYDWDFGDNTVANSTSAATQTHTYTAPGEYTAQLTVTDNEGLTAQRSLLVSVHSSDNSLTEAQASRFLTQTTFGPTREDIAELQSMGVESWLDEQFDLQGPAHLDYVTSNGNSSYRAPRHEMWWIDVVLGEDQLRQRVAFALSQIFVVSDTGYTLSNAQYGITSYYDMLRENAFGNYRELLEDVTLSPVMGIYLSTLQNARTDMEASTRADENYAREVLQLFSIGLHVLNQDGTTDGTPVFTQDTIESFARVFTGWNYANAGSWNRPLYTGGDMINHMIPFSDYHDVEQKTLLNGVTLPAGQTASEDLEMALDNIFNHPNVGPFITKQLIKRLVTSNPTPAYVSRVASVFNDDGNGERGNLQAVVRAILLDTEARNIPSFAAYGKLREPVLRMSHLWRAFNVQRGEDSSERNEFNTYSPQLMNLENVTGQAVLRSPSVFNFFDPDYAPAGPIADQNLIAPEFEIFTESNILNTTNRIDQQIQRFYATTPHSSDRQPSYLDFSYETGLANDADALLDHLDILLLSGNMSEELRLILTNHINSLPQDDDGLSHRVRDSVTLIMASPDYLIQM